MGVRTMRDVKVYGLRLIIAVSIILFLGSALQQSFGEAMGGGELIQLQQQLDAMGKAGGGTPQLPAGQSVLSCGWSALTSKYQRVDGNDPFTVGLLIPSDGRLVGAGMGKTIFRSRRHAGDPIFSLFANADRVN